MNSITTPQLRCRAAAARCDITPPVGIYHRMWGAALHDRSTGIHRPLTATLLWMEQDPPTGPGKTPVNSSPADGRILISLDHCILDTVELNAIRASVSAATGVPAGQVLITLTHTHGSGWMSRSRSHLPGGELIGPYLDGLAIRLTELAAQAAATVEPVSIVFGSGSCSLAAHRDYRDAERNQFVCGFNPTGPADDTLIVGRMSTPDGRTPAILVNYACHPTTLAWDNTLISPDWVGSMREVVESNTGGLCLFLQGASGDLGPREGFVGDPAVADRNGQQVGFAALSALAALPPAGTRYSYTGPVISGATIGTWKHQPLTDDVLSAQASWKWTDLTVDLPYRHDLPTVAQTTAEREAWQEEESKARAAGDEARLRTCRAEVEQRSRQLTRLNALAPGNAWPMPVTIGQLGDTLWVFLPGEMYQTLQTTLRERFAPRCVVVTTLTNDWQPGYVPPASVFGYGIYQEIIAATAPGCLEILIERISRAISNC